MASARQRTEAAGRAAGPIIDSKAEAIAELMLEVAQCFFRIRALGKKTGLITSWGGGARKFPATLRGETRSLSPRSRVTTERLPNN